MSRYIKILFFLIFVFFAQLDLSANDIRIVIMDFKAQNVEKSLAANVTELIRGEMINSGRFDIIERSQVDKILKEQGFQNTGCTEQSCAVQIGKLLSANKILIGTVMKIGQKNVFSGRLVDVQRGVGEFSEKQVINSDDSMISDVSLFVMNLVNRITGTENKSKDKNKPKYVPESIADEFFPDFQRDEDLESVEQESTFKSKGFQIGGWITPVFIDQKQGSNTLNASVNTLRLFLKAYLWKDSYFYLRGKDVFTRYPKHEGEYESLEQPDNLYDLDLAYVSMMSPNRVLKVSLGRKFFMVGTGLVLNGRGDGGELDLYSKYISLQLLGLYTGLLKKENNPYGLSSKEIDDILIAKRIFTGGTLNLHLNNQTLYFLGIAQIDKGEKDSTAPTLYQSQYYGGGIKGVILEGLSYHGEFIHERGKSYLAGTTQKKNIKAYAGTFNLYYFFKTRVNPALILQYAYGSGDGDRSDHKSPDTNSSGEDNGFITFGTYVGGFALRPALSNIHVARGGFSFSPFGWSQSFFIRRMSLIAKYSLYRKDKSEAPIGSGEATENNANVGQGVDVSLRWRIFHDLSFYVNYAIFMPGDAYASSERDRRNFVMAGLNLSF